MAATQRRSHGCGSKAIVQRLHRRGGGIMVTAKRPSTARRRRQGCSGCPTDAATRRAPRAPQSEGRSSSKRMGKIYWGGARRGWRRLEAGVDETPRSGGRARRGGAGTPEGGGESRRSSPEPSEEHVGDLDRQKGIRVRVRPRGERVRGAAGLGRAGSVKPTRVD
jgi:hypothetical protein